MLLILKYSITRSFKCPNWGNEAYSHEANYYTLTSEMTIHSGSFLFRYRLTFAFRTEKPFTF